MNEYGLSFRDENGLLLITVDSLIESFNARGFDAAVKVIEHHANEYHLHKAGLGHLTNTTFTLIPLEKKV